MKTFIFWIVMGATGVLSSCKDPVAPLTSSPPVVKLSKADSTKAARLNYNGDRPVWDDGEALPVYNNAIVNGPNDTVYFNKSRWNHWPLVKKKNRFYSFEGDRLEVGYIAGMGTAIEDIYESAGLTVKRRPGLHKGADILSAGFQALHVDVLLCSYKLDTTQDNWVNITDFNEQKGTVSGSFSLHYLVQNKKQTVIDRVYPNTVHMHGSFR